MPICRWTGKKWKKLTCKEITEEYKLCHDILFRYRIMGFKDRLLILFGKKPSFDNYKF